MIYFGTLVGLISVRVNPRGAAISFTCQAHKRPVVPRFLSPNAPAAILESWRRLLPDKSGRIFLAKSVTAKTLLSLLASLSGWLGEAGSPPRAQPPATSHPATALKVKSPRKILAALAKQKRSFAPAKPQAPTSAISMKLIPAKHDHQHRHPCWGSVATHELF
jgi:hypothetical protein